MVCNLIQTPVDGRFHSLISNMDYMVKKNEDSTVEDDIFGITLKSHSFPILLSFNIIGIEWESPSDVVVHNWTQAIMLYCLPSSIYRESMYSWQMIGKSRTFPSTPIIYISEAGMQVKYGARKIQGKIIHVHVEVGGFGHNDSTWYLILLSAESVSSLTSSPVLTTGISSDDSQSGKCLDY